ncbi:MAG: 5' nucleotidase, NT5C type [Peptostreptococcaceae bacterium]
MSNLNICIDIDGTITSPYHFLPYLNNMYNMDLKEEEWTTIDWTKLYGDNIAELLNKFHNEYVNAYSEASVVEFAKEIICEIGMNNNLYFVTARSEDLTEVTTTWLNENGFSDIEVYLLGSDYKIEKAKELGCNIFIEDNPNNAIQIANAGIDVILIDANYNKEISHEKITRVENWNQIKELIQNKY